VVQGTALEWSEDNIDVYKQLGAFDVVLCSDLIYAGDSSTTKCLVQSINQLVRGPDSIVISCYESRAVGLRGTSKKTSSQEQQQVFDDHMRSIGFNIVNRVPEADMDGMINDESIVIFIYSRQGRLQ